MEVEFEITKKLNLTSLDQEPETVKVPLTN